MVCNGCGEKLRNKIDKDVYYCLNDCDQEFNSSSHLQFFPRIFRGRYVLFDISIPKTFFDGRVIMDVLLAHLSIQDIRSFNYWKVIKQGDSMLVRRSRHSDNDWGTHLAWSNVFRN